MIKDVKTSATCKYSIIKDMLEMGHKHFEYYGDRA